ncbi:hypothetical protein R3P38DRAFT_3200518 [Favolaschia claudopus]|uniref:Uncharacterized protein n=1 Tax=Favolaschia claudopus TaxID=2862362 RepID=A0AAW0AY22_9AGAR
MRFISSVYVLAALLWAAHAHPLAEIEETRDLSDGAPSARSMDKFTEVDLSAARAEIDAHEAEADNQTLKVN